MANNVDGTSKWLHIGGITDAGERRMTLWADRIYLAGRVGIGTTNPQGALQVKSLTVLNEGATAAGAWANFGSNAFFDGNWKRVDPARAGVNLHMNADGGGAEFRFMRMEGNGQARNIAQLGTGASFIAEGNLGIGTTNPASRLHVAAGDLRLDAGRTISAPGRLHIAGDELLYVLNRNGMIVGKEWGGNGNLTVQGDVLLAGRIGVLGQPAAPRTGGWAGGIHTWDIEVEGSAWCRNRWETGPRDLAENYESNADLEPGDVVCFHPERDVVVLSTQPDDRLVCGVISTQPGVLLNADREMGSERQFPVTLCGRVPCKVVNESGPIRRGDLLTSSSTPGHAMKAEPIDLDGKAVYLSGTILGKALESFEAETGAIEIFVAPS